ncbi:MAG: hypothetical protein PQJ49_08045 [Sphaerochaetaceae bacterium]|nr:hypothetical protein [Sphaerochaetaceae bacterium]
MHSFKKIKSNLLLFLFVLITTFCLSSCENQESSNLIDLTLSLNSAAKTNFSKDISPSENELTVYKFKINGIGPNGETFEKETSSQSTTLSGLVKGKWEISVIGYNENDEAIVNGSGTYYLFNSKSVVDITLEYLTGQGDFSIDVYWNKDQADPLKTGVLTTYYKLENNEFIPYDVDDDVEYFEGEGHAKINGSFDAGSYILAVKLFSGPTELSGFAEQLRILANHTTVGSNTFVIGDTQLDYGINFYCNTHLPIVGVITASPEVIVEDQEIALTFTPTSLPDGYTADQIKYRWYLEGSQIDGETSNILSIMPEKGEHRYDLFAYIDGISGTLGSTKILVTCE